MAFNAVSITYSYFENYCHIRSQFLMLLGSVCEYNPFKSLYRYDKPDFGVFGIRDVAGPAFPHMKAVIWNSLETEGSKVCRGELLIILRLMLGQLRKVRLLHHDVAPVSLGYSHSLFDFTVADWVSCRS
jgi:hypothetical protein